MPKRFATLTTLILAVLGTALTAQTAKPAAAPPKILASLQGSWMFTSVDGQDLAGSGRELVVTITDTKYIQTANGAIVERGSFKIDETKKPMHMDLNITEGDEAGMTQLGVFEVTGTTMRGKLGAPGTGARPTDLAPAEGFFAFTAIKK